MTTSSDDIAAGVAMTSRAVGATDSKSMRSVAPLE
jgi:hypothetical protein